MNDLMLDNNSNTDLQKLIDEAKADPVKFAQRKYDADKYVDMLTRQKDEMRDAYLRLQEESNSRATKADLETLATQMRDLTSNNNPTVKEETKPAIDPKQIEDLISSKLSQIEENKKRVDNFNSVKNKLVEKYGENYHNSLKQQLDDLGMSSSELTELAERNPRLVFKTLGLEAQQETRTRDFFTPPRSQQNTTAAPPPQQERTWSYYQQLKQTNPRSWMSRETQLQMHNDALRLGDKFEDGDYSKYAKDARIKF